MEEKIVLGSTHRRPAQPVLINGMLSSVRSSKLFNGLSDSAYLNIVAAARQRTFVRNEEIITQGQPIASFILLVSGTVKQTQVGHNGNEVLIRFSRRGDVVNVQAESAIAYHTCSARAMERCKALVWGHTGVQLLLAEYPQIRRNISQILADQLTELEERFREVATEKVARRLSFLLLRLLRQIGQPSDRGVRVSLTRAELGQMTGATTFTVSRVLSEWADQGLIDGGRTTVIITDPERMRSMNEFT